MIYIYTPCMYKCINIGLKKCLYKYGTLQSGEKQLFVQLVLTREISNILSKKLNKNEMEPMNNLKYTFKGLWWQMVV